MALGSKFSILENDVEDRTPKKLAKNAQQQTNNGKNQKNVKNGNKKENQPPAQQVKKNSKEETNSKKKQAEPTSKKQQQSAKSKATIVSESKKAQQCPVKAACQESRFTDSKIQVFFLWFMSSIYFFAFFSFFWQIRGLYGDKGVAPLRYYAAQFSKNNQTVSFDDLYTRSPSLVWLLSRYGLSLTTCLEVVTIAGILVSFLQLLFKSFRSFPNYIFLYLTYFSLVKIGQTFYSFQWDSLLLETGILTVLVAIRPSQLGRFAPNPSLVLWPVKWLLFKLMFSSGVVKLTSRCPLWWSLRALDVHFESQCLPTSLAWYAHQMPKNWLALAVAFTYFIEIVGPFLFFVPIRGFRKFSFITQVLFQVSIILTGNYTFFNLLTIVLCFVLLHEEPSAPQYAEKPESRKGLLFSGVLVGLFAYLLGHYFALSFENVTSMKSFVFEGPESKVNFTLDEFNLFLKQAITLSIWVGGVSFTFEALNAIIKSLKEEGLFTKFTQFLVNFATVGVCAALLAASVVPLTELDLSGSFTQHLPNNLKRLNAWTSENMMVNSYGLFRSMTGEKGRPEIIIEGANDPQNDKWLPYHFLYKPGDLSQAPKFNVPYQPRLDWQMWFAALGNYQANPWLLQLCFRILSHEPDVLALLDNSRLPFPMNSPPKYLRVSRYTYKFTTDSKSPAWWAQMNNRQAYMPVVNKETVVSALKLEELKIKVPGWIEKLTVQEKRQFPSIKLALDSLYQNLVLQNVVLPHQIMLAMFAVAFYLQMRSCHRVMAQKKACKA